jgi:hypothetical protein
MSSRAVLSNLIHGDAKRGDRDASYSYASF